MRKHTQRFQDGTLIEVEMEVAPSFEHLIEQFGERTTYLIDGEPYQVGGDRQDWHTEWISQGGATQVECVLFLPVGTTEDPEYPYDEEAHYSLFWHPELKRWCQENPLGWGREDSTETMLLVHGRDAVEMR